MVYVASDGTVGGRKSTSQWIRDFFMAIYNFFALFFTSILNPPTIQSSVRLLRCCVVAFSQLVFVESGERRDVTICCLLLNEGLCIQRI